jgi:hypothetical protein
LSVGLFCTTLRGGMDSDVKDDVRVEAPEKSGASASSCPDSCPLCRAGVSVCLQGED